MVPQVYSCLQCSARVSSKGVLQGYQGKSVSHTCCATVSSKSVLPDCQISVPSQGVPQRLCLVEHVTSSLGVRASIRVRWFYPVLLAFVGQKTLSVISLKTGLRTKSSLLRKDEP